MTEAVGRFVPARWVVIAVLFAGVLFACSRLARSQANFATVYGTVTDPSGAAIPNATVTLTQPDTQVTTTKTTGDTGDFAFTFIPGGVYSLKSEAKGFPIYVNKGVVLTAGQEVRQTYRLELGASTE